MLFIYPSSLHYINAMGSFYRWLDNRYLLFSRCNLYKSDVSNIKKMYKLLCVFHKRTQLVYRCVSSVFSIAGLSIPSPVCVSGCVEWSVGGVPRPAGGVPRPAGWSPTKVGHTGTYLVHRSLFRYFCTNGKSYTDRSVTSSNSSLISTLRHFVMPRSSRVPVGFQ